MGLRCLIGHDYGELLTSRDQRARANEVVVTVREYRECARCGHQRIITENKEIKAVTPDEPGADDPAESSDGPAADTPAAGGEWGGADLHSGAGRVGGDAVEPMTAEEDDGVILEEEPERPTRARGEWPDDGREVGDDGTAGADADPADEGPEGVEFGGSLPEDLEATPDDGSADDATPDGDGEIIDAEAATDAGSSAPSGSAEAGTESAGDAPRQRPDDGDTEFVCPECGETWPTVNASLRPGDICPQCRRGYLSEQIVQ